MRSHAKCARRTQKNPLAARTADKKRRRGRSPPLEADDGRTHSATDRQPAQASHRTAYAPSDSSNCATQSPRRAMELVHQRRPTVLRRGPKHLALGRPHKEGGRFVLRTVGAVGVRAENVLCRQFSMFFFRTRKRLMNEEGGGAPVHVANGSDPLDMAFLGLQNIVARSETKQARPLTK
ncbi:hypothetical protein MOQ_010076, partial [Trypanosoma cruzi marinkellei]